MTGRGYSDGDATDLPPMLEVELARSVEAPGAARAAVSEFTYDVGLSRSTLQTLVLLVSEVVSNAVLHSSAPRSTPITLTAELGADAVRITVHDAGAGFVPRERDPESMHHGYGLYLVDKAASRWGVHTEAPTSVWFELPRDGRSERAR